MGKTPDIQEAGNVFDNLAESWIVNEFSYINSMRYILRSHSRKMLLRNMSLDFLSLNHGIAKITTFNFLHFQDFCTTIQLGGLFGNDAIW